MYRSAFPKPRQQIRLLVSLLASLAWFGHALAQGNKTCADLPAEWPTPNVNQGPINSPGANKPNDVNSLAAKAAEAKKTKFLSCSPGLLSPLALHAGSPKEPFHQRVLAAVKAKQANLSLARAIYIVQLADKGTIAKLDPGADSDWWRVQIQGWCKANDPNGTKKLPLPKPKSVVQSVAELDARAVALGWQRVQKVDADKLSTSCDSSLRDLVTRIEAQKP
jgi:hypothetical protein